MMPIGSNTWPGAIGNLGWLAASELARKLCWFESRFLNLIKYLQQFRPWGSAVGEALSDASG